MYGDIQYCSRARARVCVCVYARASSPAPDPRNEIDSVAIPSPGLAISNFVTYYILLRVDRSTIGEGLFSAKSANRKCF